MLLVHRPGPGFDDWSFPKGKVEATDVDELHAALREVEEETGLRCAIGRELPSISYVDRKGRDKTVRYWEMRPLGGAFTPNREVDEVCWLTIAEALPRLTYPHDAGVLRAFARFAGASERAVG